MAGRRPAPLGVPPPGAGLNFDSSYSRRQAQAAATAQQISLMGDYPPPQAPYGRGGGGGGGYDDDEADYKYAVPESYPERVPRDSHRAKMKMDYDYEGPSGHSGPPPQRPPREGGGGWRQRSPSPAGLGPPPGMQHQRYRNERDIEPSPQQQQRWMPRGGGGDGYRDDDEINYHQSQRMDRMDNGPYRSQQQQHSQPQQMFNQQSFAQQPQPLVMVLPSTPQNQGNLMSNPFGLGLGVGGGPLVNVLGNLPFSNPAAAAAFGQSSVTPFGSGIGNLGAALGINAANSSSSSQSSIYGAQTQQGFNRPRNLITADNRDRDRGRRDSRGGRKDSIRSDPSPRKRNLVLRDPHPEDNAKRPRNSNSNSSGKNSNSNDKVKRISLGSDRKNGSSHRPASGSGVSATVGRKSESDKSKDKDKLKDKDKGSDEKDKEPEDKDKEIKDKDKEKGEEKKKDRERKKSGTEYDGLPNGSLVCKVCQKVMNDGQSFESHLSGRAHQSLMKIVEERFAKRAELLMTESKAAENEISIESERQRRAGTGGGGGKARDKNTLSNYCKMCDCHYAQNWGTHKVSLGHRMLKEFLHPTCHCCAVHFMHRKDWLNHLISPTHIKRVLELKEKGEAHEGVVSGELKITSCVTEHESLTQDELFTVHMELNRDERPLVGITIKSLDGRESLTEEMKEILKNDRGEMDLPDGIIPLPKEYNKELMVGGDAVVAVNGSRCRICRVYIPEDKKLEEHCSSKEHFNQYVSFLKRVNKHREHKEKERKDAEEQAAREEERAKRRAQEKAQEEKDKAAAEATEKEEKEKLSNGEDKMEVEMVKPNENGEEKMEIGKSDGTQENSEKAEVENSKEKPAEEKSVDKPEEVKVFELIDVDEEDEDEDDVDEVVDEIPGDQEGQVVDEVPDGQVVFEVAEDQEGDMDEEDEDDDEDDDDDDEDESTSSNNEIGGGEEDSAEVAAVEAPIEVEDDSNSMPPPPNEFMGLDVIEPDVLGMLPGLDEATASLEKILADRRANEARPVATPRAKASTSARGGRTPALRNVKAKVDSGIRGRGGARGGRGARRGAK